MVRRRMTASATRAKRSAAVAGEPLCPNAQPPSSPDANEGLLQTFVAGSHTPPGAQSDDAEHAVRHSPVGPQRYGAHAVVVVPSFAVEDRRSSEHVATSGLHAPVTHTKPSEQ